MRVVWSKIASCTNEGMQKPATHLVHMAPECELYKLVVEQQPTSTATHLQHLALQQCQNTHVSQAVHMF
jgi:hypothetical protein